MERWMQQWLWPAVVLVGVTWAGAALISFLVADSQAVDIAEESVVRIDKAADWVACQVIVTGRIRQEAGGTSLAAEQRVRVLNECQSTDAWVLCADEEISKLSDEELSAFQSSDAVQLTRVCRDRVGTSPTPAAGAEDS